MNAKPETANGWLPISEMPMHRYAIVGRWCCGPRPKGYWHEVRANWALFNDACGEFAGKKFWSYEEPNRESVFYDDDGNYAEPTHFHPIPEPPSE